MRAVLMGLGVACCLFVVSPAWSMDEAERDRQAEAISRSIMSPFCPGRTISACPSPRAGEWRDDIRKWVGEGLDADEIRRRLAVRFPEHNLLGAPRNRLGWALPIGLTVLSLAVLWALLRRLLPATATSTSAPAAPTSTRGTAAAKAGEPQRNLDERIDQELDALD